MTARFLQFVSKWRVVALLALAGCFLFVGCTTQTKYQMLSFFFDGVPDPNAPKKDPKAFTSQRGTAASPVFVHKPYAEQNCSRCHQNTDNILARAKVPEDVCQKCHAAVATAYPVMHGPVAAGACNKCHSPHQSRNKHLLRDNARKVCMQCHTTDLLGPMPAEHLDRKADCLTCHSGHGGNAHSLLKVAITPTTQPSPEDEVPR